MTTAGTDRVREEHARRKANGTTEQPTEQPPVKKKKWRRCRELVDEILSRASEPFVTLNLAGCELTRVRAGAIVLLIGGTGRRKTSLAGCLLVEHARDHGPALSFSLELPADEWTARVIGSRRDMGWANTLQGEVPRDQMLSALPERLTIMDRDDATLPELDLTLGDLRREYPDQPLLVAVDYAQLVEIKSDSEIRIRIGEVMRAIDKIARSHRVVVIALSQSSRVASRAIASGEKIGADTTDAGAESADLERWASATLAIGELGPESPDGSCAAQLSLGKNRMGRGDVVFPARSDGRTGRWWLVGDARPASEVRAERGAAKNVAAQEGAEILVVTMADRSDKPLTREELVTKAGGKRVVARAAVVTTLERGELIEVDQRRPKSRAYLVWTRTRAEAAGVPIVADSEK